MPELARDVHLSCVAYRLGEPLRRALSDLLPFRLTGAQERALGDARLTAVCVYPRVLVSGYHG